MAISAAKLAKRLADAGITVKSHQESDEEADGEVILDDVVSIQIASYILKPYILSRLVVAEDEEDTAVVEIGTYRTAPDLIAGILAYRNTLNQIGPK